MIRWIPYTFVRTVLFFIGGILVGFYFSDLLNEMILISIVFTLALLYVTVVWFFPFARHRFNLGWIALPLIFFLGAFNVLHQTESRWPTHLLHASDSIRWYRVVITGFPEERARS